MAITAEAKFRGPIYLFELEAHDDGTLRMDVVNGALRMRRRFQDRDLLEVKRVIDAAVAARHLTT